MTFSWKLAIFNTIMEWAESGRRNVQHEIIEREVRRLTTGVVVDEEEAGVFSIRNLTLSNIQEISNAIKMGEEFGRGSSFGRMITDRIERKVMGTEVRP